MEFHCFPLNSEKLNRYPYVDEISYKIEENDKVDFIYQYVKDCYVFSPCNSYFNNYTTKYILGKPTRFPNYGNFPETFAMKTYGPEVSISPWQNKLPRIPWDNIKELNNYVYIEFHEAVYPIRVSIYEVYNPGNITEIWAENSDNHWFLLWNGSHQIVPLTSRLFSPPLRTCNFKTTKLKLKFKHNMWNNYAMIDAVMLIGSSQLILSKNSEQSLTDLLRTIKYKAHHYNNLTADHKNAHLDIDYLQTIISEYYTIYKRNIKKIVDQSNSKHKEVFQKVIPDHEPSFEQKYSNCLVRNSNFAMTFSVNESQELSRYNLSALPDEVILKILKNLDLFMLCRMNQVNKRFNNLTRDPLLYTCLNVRYMRNVNIHISNIFHYFTPRCEYLQQLDLTFSNFSDWNIIQFLNNCGRHLTHLRLNRCRTINDFVLLKISTVCKNLKVLDLTFYPSILLNRFYLKDLKNLEYLNLSNTFIDTVNGRLLCKTLQKNQRMRELYLKNSWVLNLNAVLIELRNSCPDLEIINLKGMINVTSESIDVLAGCKNLRKVNLHINSTITNNCLYRLFSSCQRLEVIHLSGVFLNKHNLKLLKCKNLIKLCLDNEVSVIPDEYSIIFEQCPKLQEFYVNCHISHLIDEWKEKFPNISVFESFYCSNEL